MDIKITDTKTIKIENGDILLVTVPVATPADVRVKYCQQLKNTIKENLGIAAVIVVTAAEMEMSIVKRNELSDLYQRIDDLEKEISKAKKPKPEKGILGIV